MSRLTLEKAEQILGLPANWDMNVAALKAAYREQIRKWHPDLNMDNLKEATERLQHINDAYDILLPVVRRSQKSGDRWAKQVTAHWDDWRAEFIKGWRKTVKQAQDGICAKGVFVGTEYPVGMDLFAYIQNFERAYVAPPPEWFYRVVHKSATAANRVAYQSWLLSVAPNKTFREEWAKRYFDLEFWGGWVFYLPSSKELLTARQERIGG